MMNENDVREMREMLVELRVTVQHLTRRVDELLTDNKAEISDIKNKLYEVERKMWMIAGATGAISALLPYLIRTLTGGNAQP
jgi:hypothetical protein